MHFKNIIEIHFWVAIYILEISALRRIWAKCTFCVWSRNVTEGYAPRVCTCAPVANRKKNITPINGFFIYAICNDLFQLIVLM